MTFTDVDTDRQKLDFILGTKVIQFLKLSKNVFYKKCGPKFIFFNENFRKIWTFFDKENVLSYLQGDLHQYRQFLIPIDKNLGLVFDPSNP